MEFPLMTVCEVKLDFHPVVRWVVNGDVLQAAHGPANRISIGAISSDFE